MDDPLFSHMMMGWAAILGTFLSIALGYTIRQILAYVKTRMNQEQFVILKEAAQTMVRYLEMSSAWDNVLKEGAARKEKAFILLEQWAAKKGIPLTHELADQLIEEAVNVMNSEMGDVWEEYVGLPANIQSVPLHEV